MPIAPVKSLFPFAVLGFSGFQKTEKESHQRTKQRSTGNAHPDPAVVPDPTAAITRPPMAGPTARAMLNPAELSATAAANFAGGTRSGVSACHAGSFITAPTPSRNVNTSRVCGVTVRVRVITPSTVAAATIELWVKSRNLRRSTMSASAPAGKAINSTGRLTVTCTRATHIGELVSEVISQPVATFCIQLPV